MTTGGYLLSGHDGPYALERFTCGPDGDGWRYEAVRDEGGRIELSLHGDTVRLHAEAGGWVLRAAAAGGQAFWRRGEQEHSAAVDGLTGSSPAFLVACARLGPGRHRLLEVTDPVLAVRTVAQQWARLDDQDGWQVDDLEAGERRAVRLAGDLVVDAPGVQLVEAG